MIFASTRWMGTLFVGKEKEEERDERVKRRERKKERWRGKKPFEFSCPFTFCVPKLVKPIAAATADSSGSWSIRDVLLVVLMLRQNTGDKAVSGGSWLVSLFVCDLGMVTHCKVYVSNYHSFISVYNADVVGSLCLIYGCCRCSGGQGR